MGVYKIMLFCVWSLMISVGKKKIQIHSEKIEYVWILIFKVLSFDSCGSTSSHENVRKL